MGDLWMHTETLSGSLDGIGRVGEALGDDYESVSRAIQERQAGIGAGDLMAGAFRRTYDDPAEIVRTSAGQTPRVYADLAGAGVAGMTIYIGGETINAETFMAMGG